MPTTDDQLSRDQVALLVTRAQGLDEWKAVTQELARQRDLRVTRLVSGALDEAEYRGVAGEVRGIELVLRVMTPKPARNPARNERQEDAA